MSHSLEPGRKFHSSWATVNGVFLIGGVDASSAEQAHTSSVLVKPNNVTIPGFDLKYKIE